MYQELKQDNLQQMVADRDLVIVQYSASWCGNCRVIKPKFKQFSLAHEAATFVVVDAENFPNARKLAKVNNLPTFAAFRNGKLITQIQTNKANNLKNFIDEVTHN